MANEQTKVSLTGFAKTAVYLEMIFSVGMLNDKVYAKYVDFLEQLKNEGFNRPVFEKEFFYRIKAGILIEQMRDFRQQFIQRLSYQSGNSVYDIQHVLESRICSEFSEFITEQQTKE